MQSVPFCKSAHPKDSGILDQVLNLNSGVESVQFDCQAGYPAVYRVCFIVTLFFLLMAVLMIGVRTSKDPRAGIQNGFWAIKYIIVIGGMIGAFFIPGGDGPGGTGTFGKCAIFSAIKNNAHCSRILHLHSILCLEVQ